MAIFAVSISLVNRPRRRSSATSSLLRSFDRFCQYATSSTARMGYQPNSRDNKPPNAHCVNMESNACANKKPTKNSPTFAAREHRKHNFCHLSICLISFTVSVLEVYTKLLSGASIFRTISREDSGIFNLLTSTISRGTAFSTFFFGLM